MKKFTLILFPILFSSALLSAFKSAKDPLENTKWRGILLAPDPIDAILDFQSDICYIRFNNEVIETTAYQVSGDTIIFKKMSGGSPCESIQIGKYLFSIQHATLKLKIVQDPCDARVAAFLDDGYVKMK